MIRFFPLNFRSVFTCLILFTIFHFFSTPAFSNKKNQTNYKVQSLSVLKRILKKSIKRNCRKTKKLGFMAQSLTVGDILYSHFAHRKKIPASNVKILTSIASLFHLRPEYYLSQMCTLFPLY